MSAVVHQLKPTPHKPYKCDCSRSGCQYCDGGLTLCTVCGGFEGQLLPACPGYRLAMWEHDAVHRRHLRTVRQLEEQRARLNALPPDVALAYSRLLEAARELEGKIGVQRVTLEVEIPPRYGQSEGSIWAVFG
jgi:hypothetical protein